MRVPYLCLAGACAVVFGIMIDTFGQLRDEAKARVDDIRNTCFVCNKGREEFDTKASGFEHHIEHDHNVRHA